MECIHVGLCIFVYDTAGDDDRSAFVCSSNAIQRETAGQAGDRAKETFKCLREMVRDVILVYLPANEFT